MRERLRALAPYISLLGLFLILVAVLLPVYVRQTGAATPAWLPWAVGIVGVVMALVWPFLRPDELRAALGARQTRHGGNALVLVAAVLLSLGVLNYLSYKNYTLWDFTGNKQYSISRQTIQILDDLDDAGQPIRLTAILSSAESSTADDLARLVDRYRTHSKLVTFERIDPQVDRLKMIELGQRLGNQDSLPSRALISEMGDRHETIYTGFDEQSVTEAILKVMRADKVRVAFTTGHDEYDPDGSGERGYGAVKQELEREGYEVDKLNLASITQTLTAETVDAVVVVGPKRPFLPQEARALAAYVAGGGSALIMLDPMVDAGLGAVLQPWDIRPNDDVVIQPGLLGLSASVWAQGNDYQFHTITKDMTGRNALFVGTRSLTTGTPVTSTMQTTPLVQLGSNGEWGETNLENLQANNVTKDAQDTATPLTVAVAGEDAPASTDEPDAAAPEGFGRLVVFGSSSLASDAMLQQFPAGGVANFDFFLNAVNWLTQDEALISIRPTQADDHPIQPPKNPLLMVLALSLLVPLAVLGVGAWFYWRRR